MGTADGNNRFAWVFPEASVIAASKCGYGCGHPDDRLLGIPVQSSDAVPGTARGDSLSWIGVDHWGRGIRIVDRREGLIVAAGRLCWTDLLFAVPVALADHHSERSRAVAGFQRV